MFQLLEIILGATPWYVNKPLPNQAGGNDADVILSS